MAVYERVCTIHLLDALTAIETDKGAVIDPLTQIAIEAALEEQNRIDQDSDYAAKHTGQFLVVTENGIEWRDSPEGLDLSQINVFQLVEYPGAYMLESIREKEEREPAPETPEFREAYDAVRNFLWPR